MIWAVVLIIPIMYVRAVFCNAILTFHEAWELRLFRKTKNPKLGRLGFSNTDAFTYPPSWILMA